MGMDGRFSVAKQDDNKVKFPHSDNDPSIFGKPQVDGVEPEADDDEPEGEVKEKPTKRQHPVSARLSEAEDTVSYTEAVVSERFTAKVLRGRYLYTRQFGWLKWSGKRWKPVDEEAVIELGRSTLLKWYGADLAEAMSSNDKNAQGLLKRLVSRGGITAVVALCRGLVLEDGNKFDRHPDLVNVANGVVDLRTGDLKKHDPSLLMMKLTNVRYEPDAAHDDWNKIVSAVRDDTQEYLQIRLGQALTGYVPDDDVNLFLHGTGHNAKSTFIGVVMKAMGDYCRVVSDKVLLGDAGGATTELFDLFGLRCGFVEELPDGARRLNVGMLKKTTAAKIHARKLYKDGVDFDPTHALVITSNYRPTVVETDHGTWRRLRQITFPFTYRKTEEEVVLETDRLGDRGLRDRAKADPEVRQAALAWLIAGARKWYAAGRVMPEDPESVKQDTLDWRGETDVVLQYFHERLELDEDSHIVASDLIKDFNLWLGLQDKKLWSDKLVSTRFGDHDMLAQHGVHKKQKKLSANDLPSRPKLSEEKVGQKYNAWFGLKFRSSDAKDSEDRK